MRIIETKVYKLEEHPNKDLCYEWMRNNWHDLNSHSVDEICSSLRALQGIIGGELDYAISQTPDRGEYIRFTNYDKEALSNLKAEDLPLTGVCWDFDLINGLIAQDPERVLRTLHLDSEHVYSDEGLDDLCEANTYEFTEEGKFIH